MRVRRGLAAAGIAAALVVSGTVAAQAAHAPTPTSVSSWREHDVRRAGTVWADVVTVTPALGRTVELQERVDGAWVTRSTLRLDTGHAARLTVRLTSHWAERPVTWWRLHLPATPTAAAATTPVKRVEARWAPSDDPASPQVLVNKQRPLDPVDWAPDDLVTPDVPTFDRHFELRPVAARALERLAAAAHAATGQRLVLASGYRPYAYQQELYARYVRQHGPDAADEFSARAGHSEHQTGLAADVTAEGVRFTEVGSTALGRWLADHAWEHGFVVRYPEGGEALTGYRPEPWHLRYVGPELAAYVHHGGFVTLEDAFGVDPAPDYPRR
ncbi:M15 family metallopeptidase [Isoptericola variabilis]|uniref:Peptidase M15B and M15C DD-carboxypeptidase VanY/endolysin n=1 Tax=Isoptericola variabilis (strain 225) TaxID=743718 RepID=F6FVS7_ISOV2|nr:M15 family metallopeptidase [Isoptericola variabilis]AEG45578.1 peptidase M15B and M15C DD-carboxypeptidase VanY/endolysin [Isoptericola variabilis 225]TWH25814.1 D-alanyl-D-alanine carboxypeptidase [Isoptericola variabilis J7]